MNLEPEGAVGRLNPLPSPQMMNTTTMGIERTYPPLAGGTDTLQQNCTNIATTLYFHSFL